MIMTQDELAVMDGGKCICMIRGVRPFLSDKYDITSHPKYKKLADYDPNNTFDIVKYMNQRQSILKPGEMFDLYEIPE